MILYVEVIMDTKYYLLAMLEFENEFPHVAESALTIMQLSHLLRRAQELKEEDLARA
jgi:hypothetical protein